MVPCLDPKRHRTQSEPRPTASFSRLAGALALLRPLLPALALGQHGAVAQAPWGQTGLEDLVPVALLQPLAEDADLGGVGLETRTPRLMDL